jgi:hypothetical protein
MGMKRTILFSGIISILLASCGSHEVEKSHLLEYWNNGVYSSAAGSAVKYSSYKNSVLKSYIWNIYGSGVNSISMWVPDTTFVKNTYTCPAFSVTYKTSDSKTYHASVGEFRLLGLNNGDLAGDFHCTLKNAANPNDSLMITKGYFMIYLQYHDSLLAK